jgi:N-acetylglucosaminyl-diphospho-decaprenol L-rhamnosyltransferase
MLDLAVIIVSWNVRDYLADCLRSVYADLHRCGLQGEVWVVDNASTDGTQELLANLFAHTRLIANEDNPGFAAANNQAMRQIMAEYGDGPRHLFFLNPDTFVRSEALGHMARHLDERPDVGVVGARLVYGDGRFQHSAFYFPGLRQLLFDLFPMPSRLYDTRLNGRYPRRFYHPNGQPFAVDHPLGAAMMVRRNVAEATRGFDESYHMYCEEIDWCWRIRKAGWGICAVPRAEIVHYGGQSTKQIPARSIVNLWRSRAQLYRAHHRRIGWLAARKLVLLGMRYQARRAKDAAMRQAYQEAAQLWRGQR